MPLRLRIDSVRAQTASAMSGLASLSLQPRTSYWKQKIIEAQRYLASIISSKSLASVSFRCMSYLHQSGLKAGYYACPGQVVGGQSHKLLFVEIAFRNILNILHKDRLHILERELRRIGQHLDVRAFQTLNRVFVRKLQECQAIYFLWSGGMCSSLVLY